MIHPVIHLLNHRAEISDKSNPKYILSLLWDLLKAFDVMSHKILQQKWHNYGIQGIICLIEAHMLNLTILNLHCEALDVPYFKDPFWACYSCASDIQRSNNFNILSFGDNATVYTSHCDLNLFSSSPDKAIKDLYVSFGANKRPKYIVINLKTTKCNFVELNVNHLFNKWSKIFIVIQ